MNEEIPIPVDTRSTEFKEGVEAGLNSPEDTKNCIAGNDLGQALKEEPGDQTPAALSKSTDTPLFMNSSPERPRGNAQDEKDETEE